MFLTSIKARQMIIITKQIQNTVLIYNINKIIKYRSFSNNNIKKMKKAAVKSKKNKIIKENHKIDAYFLKVPAKTTSSTDLSNKISNKIETKNGFNSKISSEEIIVLEDITNSPEKCTEIEENVVKKRKQSIEQFDCTTTTNKEEEIYDVEENGYITYPPYKRVCNYNGSVNVEENVNLENISHSKKELLQTPKKFNSTNKTQTPEEQQKMFNKTKNSSTKIFTKSPASPNEFNIQVMENFIKTTPSKFSKQVTSKTETPNKSSKQQVALKIETPKSSKTSQSTLLSYVSPCSSVGSVKAQQSNEKTPTKILLKNNPQLSPNVLKVKTKLDFSFASNDAELKADCKNNGTSHPQTEEDFGFLLQDSWEDALNDSINKLDLLQENSLDLTESQRCKVLEINNFPNKLVIKVQSSHCDKQAYCNLLGFWSYMKVNIGDHLHLHAVKEPDSIFWFVNNDEGFIVYEPDYLISSTSLVGALFCKRRSVLSDKYPGFDTANRYMINGILVHKLLQNALKNKVSSVNDVNTILQQILSSKETIKMLYESSLTLQELEDELKLYVPQVSHFIEQYVNNNSNEKKKSNWQGNIKTIKDIEENIWCPDIGIKGKIDVSVIAKNNEIMPLELKTGKATMSLEHRGQIFLYIMAMNKLGYSVSSGLLLYLKNYTISNQILYISRDVHVTFRCKTNWLIQHSLLSAVIKAILRKIEGILKEVIMNEREKRDLMIFRNDLVYYLTRTPKIMDATEDDVIDNSVTEFSQNDVSTAELPHPINHHSACKRCPYNTICTVYLKYENYDLSNYKNLMEIQKSELEHLEYSHLQYFMHWSNLISLETSYNSGNKNLREIYTVSPQQREKSGKCIFNLQIAATELNNDLYYTSFHKQDKNDEYDFLNSGFDKGTYIIISTDIRPAVATSFITEIKNDSVTLSIDKDLSKLYPNSLFHLDTFNSSTSFSFNMTNLAMLLKPTERAKQLRDIIIDKKVPTFQNKIPKTVGLKGKSILQQLNKIQQRAVLKAITANDYLLIKGMPGTGKTATIVALIRLLVELDQTVLITSHTHSAVDNVCLRLQEHGIKILRLGTEHRIHPKLHSSSEHVLTRNCTTVEQLEEVYNTAKVIAVTCLGTGHPILSKRVLDVCIVDESTQVLQCSVIRALNATRKFVLVGDPEQLPPIVRNYDAMERGLSESLFKRLQTSDSAITLTINYRMNKPITAVANALTYQDQLLIADESLANSHLDLPNLEKFLSYYKEQPWIVKALDNNLSSAVQILDVGPTWQYSYEIPWLSKSKLDEVLTFPADDLLNCTNPYETAVVVTLINALLLAGVHNDKIGVIAPYCAQVAQLSSFLTPLKVEVNTVDQFQGRDKSIIIYSCTKSSQHKNFNNNKKYEILEDKRRLTVAVTRAKHKLLIIGDIKTIQKYGPFSQLFNKLEKELHMSLQNNQQGFCWDNVLSFYNTPNN